LVESGHENSLSQSTTPADYGRAAELPGGELNKQKIVIAGTAKPAARNHSKLAKSISVFGPELRG
jgi:hypothetical protein